MSENHQKGTIELHTFRNSFVVLMPGPITVIWCLLLCGRQLTAAFDNCTLACFIVWHEEWLYFKYNRPWVCLVKWELFSQVLRDKTLKEKRNQLTFCNYCRKFLGKKGSKDQPSKHYLLNKSTVYFSVLNKGGNYIVT